MKKISLAQLNSKSIKTLVAKTATTASKKLAASAGKQSNGFNFNLIGLEFEETEQMPALTNGDLVGHTETHALGGGEWSIEVYDQYGSFIKEFVGLNGTQPGEEATDLWAEYDEWAEKIAKPAKNVAKFRSPDGTVETKWWFYNEAKRGRLHGLICQSF